MALVGCSHAHFAMLLLICVTLLCVHVIFECRMNDSASSVLSYDQPLV